MFRIGTKLQDLYVLLKNIFFIKFASVSLIPEIFPKGEEDQKLFSWRGEGETKIFRNFKGGTNLLGHYACFWNTLFGVLFNV